MEAEVASSVEFLAPARPKYANIKIGDRMSETQYYKVTGIGNGRVTVENERGFSFDISKGIVEEGMYSANQYEKEVFVNRTKLIELFNSVADTIFTVCFMKQPKAEEINTAIEACNKGKILSIKDMKATVKEAFKGEERVMVGYLLNTETGFGRSTVIDLDVTEKHKIRQVDHRTLKYLIHKGIKYTVK